MTDAIYCTDADVYAFGVPRGEYANPARLVQRIASASDEMVLRDHGLTTGDPVRLRADAGGSLPSPIVDGVTYYAIARSSDAFALSLTAGGAAIDLASGGSNVLLCTVLPIAEARWAASREIEDMLPAHVVPLVEPYPPMVRLATAELAAARLGYFRRRDAQDAGTLRDLLQKALTRWGRGVPVRVAPGQGQAAPAASGAGLSATFSDSRGWARYGGL